MNRSGLQRYGARHLVQIATLVVLRVGWINGDQCLGVEFWHVLR